VADLADVETAIKGLLVGAIYPTGTANPSAIICQGEPVPVKVGRGWPTVSALGPDLAAGVANVTIYSQPGSERNTTRFPRDWAPLTPAAATITVLIVGSTITLGGTISTPQNVAIVNADVAYVYAVQPGDTLASIASSLAAQITVNTPATSNGPVITLSAPTGLSARAGGVGAMIRELRRQERLFQISTWCATPEQRDAVASFVDETLAGMGLPNGREFITLPDGSKGRLLYVRSVEIDRDALVQSYRRDLIVSVDYATTDTQAVGQIVTIETTITTNQDSSPVITLNQ
jgi:hypothetical protein